MYQKTEGFEREIEAQLFALAVVGGEQLSSVNPGRRETAGIALAGEPLYP